MVLIGIIFLGLLLFTGFGILGWILKLFEIVFDILFEGCLNSLGCLVTIVLFFFIMLCVFGLM